MSSMVHLKSAQISSSKTDITAKDITIGMLEILNTTAAKAYVQVFINKAAADVTLGTTVPDVVIGVPASGGAVIPFDGGWFVSGPLSMAGTTDRTNNVSAAIDVTIWTKR